MRKVRLAAVLSGALLLVLGLVGPVRIALGATIAPTVFTDDIVNNGNCTLREAVVAANGNVAVDLCPAGSAGADVIPLGTGTYLLTIEGDDDLSAAGDLDVRDDLSIIGQGATATVIDGEWPSDPDRILEVVVAGTDLVLQGATLQDGADPGGDNTGGGLRIDDDATATVRNAGFRSNEAEHGGGVVNYGTLTLDHVVVSENTVTGCCGGVDNENVATLSHVTVINNSGGNDAGVFMEDGSISNSTISGNVGIEQGAGISACGDTSLTNVTISGNSTTDEGGGFYVCGTVSMNNVTITGNTADRDNDGVGNGGGVFISSGDQLTIRNSIVAGNSVGASQGPDCFGTATSTGHNLIRDTSGCTFSPGAGDETGVDPVLGPLADNGGPTQTHALLQGSPAIDAGGPDCAATDQRGLPRNCDIGAYELTFCQKVAVNRIGTEGNDVLTGTTGSDGFLAFGGKDRVKALGGKDGVCAGPGKDRVSGGGGKDRLAGEGGKDVLKGGGGTDVLIGGPGKDTCVGQAGKDKARSCEEKKSIP